MNSSRICHTQIITEPLQVWMLVWEAKQKVQIVKAVETSSGEEQLLCRGGSGENPWLFVSKRNMHDKIDLY